MAASLPASGHGLETVDAYRKLKGWKKLDEDWAELAGVSTTTLRRFWEGRRIQQTYFKAICQAVGIEDWEAIVDKEALICSSSIQPTESPSSAAPESDCVVYNEATPHQHCNSVELASSLDIALIADRLKPAATQTKSASADYGHSRVLHPAKAGFVPVAPDFQPAGDEVQGVSSARLEPSEYSQTQDFSFTQQSHKAFAARPVPLDSPFYVERLPIESDCYNEIKEPGALIRIKALRQMGKTSLTNRILAHAQESNYRTVRLNLRQAERTVLSNLDKFLRWFCANVSQQLQLEPMLDDYWDEELMGSLVSCTSYFQAYLLEQINSPLVLSLDEVERIFEYPDIAQDFFPLLRNWYEEANNLEIWKQLRIIVLHSTEVYVPLKINQSPFNVGLQVELPEFSLQQLEDLARRHQLDLTQTQLKQLMAMVGGHPFLVQLAFYRIGRQEVTLEQLLLSSPTESGIYIDHLRRHLVNLQQNRELAAAFKKVVTTDASVQLEPMQVYQLQRMGLVQLDGNEVTPRCNLYRQYFCTSIC